jgi:hypothetical protein
MNIFKVSNEQSSPAWLNIENENNDFNLEDININNEINEDEICLECCKIEACANNNKIYHYNSRWDMDTVSHLREFANACGLSKDSFKSINPQKVIEQQASLNKDKMERTASVNVEDDNDTITLKDLWKDPFKIEERSDMSHMSKAAWETVKSQNVMKEISVMNTGVLPLRGDDNYFANPDTNLAKNQNSITNPNAIEQFANDESYDNGVRLKKEKEDKIQQKIEQHAKWEQDQIDAMKHKDIVPRGNVFPTEVLNASTGLNNRTQMGVYSDFDFNNLPEKTAGETLNELNLQKKQSIQREKENNEWEKPSCQSAREISESFIDSLSAMLNKMEG